MKKCFIGSVVGGAMLLTSCGPGFNPEITSEDLLQDLSFLASDNLKGRFPGTLEDSILLHFIAGKFSSDGLELYNESGIQKFDFTSSITIGNNNSFSIGEKEYQCGIDFIPTSFSSSVTLSAPIIFAGYGFDFSTEKLTRNDYGNIDPDGKWVLIMRGNPDNNNPANLYVPYETDRNKAMLAKDKGASGIIFVSGYNFDPSDRLMDLKDMPTEIGIPCLHVTRKVADDLFSSIKDSLESIEKKLSISGTVFSIDLKKYLTATTNLVKERASSGNVIAILKGNNPELSDEFIIIGAHHDHLGMGGKGSSSRQPDTTAIHYGADDNASGVSALLELAEKFTTLKPERSIIFVTFGAEEKGIIGSRYFVENPPVPIEKIMAMINIDMVGRMKPDSSLQIGGIGTSPSFPEIITKLNNPYHFKLQLTTAGYGPSDHASFYAKDKPVLFFTTGVHEDYHLPSDKIEFLNIDALKTIVLFIKDISMYLADSDSFITFREAGPKTIESRAYRGKISLGIMPDIGAEGKGGVVVLAVTAGKPASLGGIMKGDIIIAMEGKPVEDIYEYMYRLGQFKAGDVIKVTVKRGDEKVDLLIQL